MQNVAVLGLGVMGAGMANNIRKAGFGLSVYNRTRAKAEAFAGQGGRIAETPREAATDADLILSMVGDDEASRAMWLGADGALAGAKPDAILVECSTLTIDWIRELAALTAEKGNVLLDAPVTGSKDAAEAGTLGLLVGGDADVLERARPVLTVISQRITHMGASGAGATMKLVNNLMAAVQAASLAEGLVLAERAGLNMEQVVSLLVSGSVASPIVKLKAQRMVDHHYTETAFALRWMHKDTTYALRAADEFGAPLPTVATAREVYRMARNLGLEDADFAAVIEALRPKT